MRYLISILMIAVLVTAVIVGYYFQRPVKRTSEVALKINALEVSADEYRDYAAERPYAGEDSREIVDSLVTRELLVQEAKRLNIDKEEAFRKTIERFYEQSLAKTLLERKAAAFSVDPSPAEIDKFLSLQRMKIDYCLLPVPGNPGEAGAPGQEKEQIRQDVFANLSTMLQLSLLALKPGETSAPFMMDGQRFRIRLLQSTPSPATSVNALDRAQVRRIMAEASRSEALDNWLYDLRRNAHLTVNDSLVGTNGRVQ